MKKYELILSWGGSTLCVEVLGDDAISSVIRIAQAINHGKATAHLSEVAVQRVAINAAFDEPASQMDAQVIADRYRKG